MNEVNVQKMSSTELDLLELTNYRSREQIQIQLQVITQNLMAIANEQRRRAQLKEAIPSTESKLNKLVKK